MLRRLFRGVLPAVVLSALLGCDKLRAAKAEPLAASRDFWVDRCDFKYRGRDFPVTGTISDMVRLLGPYDRLDTLGSRYFWDSLGLQVGSYWGKEQIRSLDLYFAREESSSEIGFRLSGRPEDLKALADIRSSYPHGFFRGEFVLEGARVGPVVDFEAVNDTRYAYLRTQSGPDAQVRPIRASWSATRYAYERTCADGRHLRFIFTLLSTHKPFRLETISVGSDNVQDSVHMPQTGTGE